MGNTLDLVALKHLSDVTASAALAAANHAAANVAPSVVSSMISKSTPHVHSLNVPSCTREGTKEPNLSDPQWCARVHSIADSEQGSTLLYFLPDTRAKTKTSGRGLFKLFTHRPLSNLKNTLDTLSHPARSRANSDLTAQKHMCGWRAESLNQVKLPHTQLVPAAILVYLIRARRLVCLHLKLFDRASAHQDDVRKLRRTRA